MGAFVALSWKFETMELRNFLGKKRKKFTGSQIRNSELLRYRYLVPFTQVDGITHTI